MSNHSVAQRYADALFAVAQAHGSLDKVDQDLGGITQILADHPDLAMLWESPIVSTEDKKQVVRQLFEGKIDAMALNTLLLMFDNKRGSGILALQQAFHARYNEHRKRAKVRVVSALPLDSREADELRAQLAKSTEREIDMDTTVDPDLIGGLVVTIGDTVIDNSLRGRLEAMARTLV